MTKKGLLLLTYLFTIVVLNSCINQKKIQYLQVPPETSKVFELKHSEGIPIKPNDELYIKVSSFDHLEFDFFSSERDLMNSSFANELSLSLITYSVSDSGTIYFPILGSIYVKDLTIPELTAELTNLLKDYFNQPTVIIKYAYKKITILGEVNAPGTYTYSRDQITLFEALGLAGDLTIHGDRKEIILLRTNEHGMQKEIIDITDDYQVFGTYYFLRPDDVVYVTPRKSMKWGTVSTPISLIFSTITTTILLLNYFN